MNTLYKTIYFLIGWSIFYASAWGQTETDSLDYPAGPDTLNWRGLTQPLMLSGDKNFASFGLLDSSVGDFQFFFTGEQHYQKINARLQWQFLRYLHQRGNVRTLILESGYSYGMIVNEYLKTGNQKLLDKALAVSPICPENQRKLYQLIYQFNEGLPEAERIYVLGIDLEYEPELSLQALNQLMEGDNYPKAISKNLRKLRRLHRSDYYDEQEVRRFFKRMQADMERNIVAHVDYWGDNFPTAAYIVDNTVRGQKFGPVQLIFQEIMEDKNLWEEREQRMFENFLLLRKQAQKGNYYGQFGTLHAFLQPVYWEFPSLARRLNTRKDSPVKGKVLSIVRYIPDLVASSYQPQEQSLVSEVADYVSESYPGNVVLTRLSESLVSLQGLSQYMLIIDPELLEPACK